MLWAQVMRNVMGVELMSIPKEINDAFYTGNRSEKIKYVINDTVKITDGEYKGKEAAVISVESIEPNVSFLLETFDGTGDIIVTQSFIKLLIPSEVGKK